MEVTFRKLVEQRVSTWDALRGKRIRFRGATMALGRGGLPHDLIHILNRFYYQIGETVLTNGGVLAIDGTASLYCAGQPMLVRSKPELVGARL